MGVGGEAAVTRWRHHSERNTSLCHASTGIQRREIVFLSPTHTFRFFPLTASGHVLANGPTGHWGSASDCCPRLEGHCSVMGLLAVTQDEAGEGGGGDRGMKEMMERRNLRGFICTSV